jgi:hypothetical protein
LDAVFTSDSTVSVAAKRYLDLPDPTREQSKTEIDPDSAHRVCLQASGTTSPSTIGSSTAFSSNLS